VPTVAAMDLVYVTGADCHLCEHGRTVLGQLRLTVREIDVESPEAAELARGGVPLSFLPVLSDGRRVVAYGRLSEKRLRRDLAL
jgi:hypothetical protein